jgi:hypothetical protein
LSEETDVDCRPHRSKIKEVMIAIANEEDSETVEQLLDGV